MRLRAWIAASAALAIVAPLVLAAPALAGQGNQGKGQGKGVGQGVGKGAGKGGELTEERVLEVVFSEIERHLIRDYFRDLEGSGRGLPPGLAKRETLPPGLQKQLVRKGTLPPGLQAKALPGDLLTRLPRRGPGYDRVVVGNDVLLIRAGTRIILDVLKDVIRG